MYARVSIFRCRPGTADEAVNIVRESILPDATGQPGFRGAFGLTTGETNQAIVITLWETQADLLDSRPGEHYATQSVELARLDELMAGNPVQEICEVKFQM